MTACLPLFERSSRSLGEKADGGVQMRHSMPIFKLFASDKTFREIASIVGRSVAWVSNAYNSEFKDAFPRRQKGWARRRSCTQRRLQILAHRPPKNPDLKAIFLAAKKAGCMVRQVPLKRYLRFKSRELHIDHRLCSVSVINAVHAAPRLKREGYARTELSRRELEKTDVKIFHVHVGYFRRNFIVPTKDILQAHRDVESPYITVYIPLEREISEILPHRIDFTQYENAWHRIKKA